MPIIELLGTLAFGGTAGVSVMRMIGCAENRQPLSDEALKRTAPSATQVGAVDSKDASLSPHEDSIKQRSASSITSSTASSTASSPRESLGLDFELWVETDLDPAWCLEGSRQQDQPCADQQDQPCADKQPQQHACDSWRTSCTTSTITRSWDEFEKLSRPAACLAAGVAPVDAEAKRACFEALGLAEDATSADLARAFRQKALLCHPDKQCNLDGSEDDPVLRAEREDKYCRITATVRALERELALQEGRDAADSPNT